MHLRSPISPCRCPCPGEDRRRPRLFEVLLAVAVVVGLCSLGGVRHARPARAAHAPAARRPIVAAAQLRAPRARRASADEGAAFVARSLRDRGLRFGTDGSTRALWEYLRAHAPDRRGPRARPGDVLFFDTRATDADPDCDDVTDHAGIVESVEPDGRIIFVEARAGQVRRSVVDPAHPTLAAHRTRRDREQLPARPKRVANPPNARYFAGQMLCGIARADR